MRGAALLLLALAAPLVAAFQLPTSHRGTQSRRSTCIVSAQASPADATALDRTGQMASKIAERLTEKLDNEWGEHEDHARVGGEAGRFYSEARAAGTVDIGELLLAVGTGMQGVDMGDCFVGPWDIANDASDVLMNENFGAGYGSDCSCKSGTKWMRMHKTWYGSR